MLHTSKWNSFRWRILLFTCLFNGDAYMAHRSTQKYNMCFFHIFNCRSIILHAFVFSNTSTSSQDKDKKVKNERERVRTQKTNTALEVIKNLIMTLSLISEEAKKKPRTEANNSPDGRGNYHSSTLSYCTYSLWSSTYILHWWWQLQSVGRISEVVRL